MYSTGDSDLNIKITSEKDVTIDFVVNEADQMYAKAKKLRKELRSRPNVDINAVDESIMDILREAHPQFCKAYPIVLRYMCSMHSYDTRAFRTYLLKIQAHPYTSESEYLDSQTDYVVMLYKAKHKRWNNTDVGNLRRNIRAQLQYETDKFRKCAIEMEQKVNEELAQLNKRNVDELREFAQLVGPKGMELAGTVRVEAEQYTAHCDQPDISSQYPDQSNDQTNITAEQLLNGQAQFTL